MKAALSTLIERVAGASGGGRELDALIACAVDGFFIDGEDPWGRPKFCFRDADGGKVMPGQGHDMLVRPYTASLDAALALVERVLPGWERHVRILSDVETVAGVVAPGPDFSKVTTSTHKTAPLAVCLALLTALSSQQGADDGAGEE